jgi:hypothetical protein
MAMSNMVLPVAAALAPPLPQVWRGSNASVARLHAKSAKQNYPQPKWLAGLAFFGYVSRQRVFPACHAVARYARRGGLKQGIGRQESYQKQWVSIEGAAVSAAGAAEISATASVKRATLAVAAASVSGAAAMAAAAIASVAAARLWRRR